MLFIFMNKVKKKKKCIHVWKLAYINKIERRFDTETILLLYCEKCGTTKKSSDFS